jgi:hypothetical protein
VDLIRYGFAQGVEWHIALASDDADFLPAVGCVARRKEHLGSLSLIRFDRESTYMDELLAVGVKIVAA